MAMEDHHFQWVNQLSITNFNSYVTNFKRVSHFWISPLLSDSLVIEILKSGTNLSGFSISGWHSPARCLDRVTISVESCSFLLNSISNPHVLCYLVGGFKHLENVPFIFQGVFPTDFHILQGGRYTANQLCYVWLGE